MAIAVRYLPQADEEVLEKSVFLVPLSLIFTVGFLGAWWMRRGLQVDLYQGGFLARKKGKHFECRLDHIQEIWRAKCEDAGQQRVAKRGVTVVRNDGARLALGKELARYPDFCARLELATLTSMLETASWTAGSGSPVSFGDYRVSSQGIELDAPTAMGALLGGDKKRHRLSWSEVRGYRFKPQWLCLDKPGTDWYLVYASFPNIHVFVALLERFGIHQKG